MGAEGLKPTRACIWRDLLCLALAALCAGTHVVGCWSTNPCSCDLLDTLRAAERPFWAAAESVSHPFLCKRKQWSGTGCLWGVLAAASHKEPGLQGAHDAASLLPQGC